MVDEKDPLGGGPGDGKRTKATLDLSAEEVEPSGSSDTGADEPEAAHADTSDDTPGARSNDHAAGGDDASSADQPPRTTNGDGDGNGNGNGKGGGRGIGGFVSHMLAAILGVAVSFAGAQYFPEEVRSLFASAPASAPAAEVEALEERLAGLEQELETQAERASAAELDERLAALETVDERLARLDDAQQQLADKTAALETTVTEAQGEAATADGEALAALREDVDQLRQTLQGFSEAPDGGTTDQGALIARIAGLNDKLQAFEDERDARVAALEQSIDERLAGRAAEQENLRTRLGEVAEATERASRAAETNAQAVKSLESAREALDTRIAGLAKADEAGTSEIGALRDRLGSLEQRLTANSEALQVVRDGLSEIRTSTDTALAKLARPDDITSAVTPIERRLTGVEEKVADVVESERTRQQSTSRIVLALELKALERAIERGEPIAGPLEKVQALSPEDIDLSALERFAETGVPTAAELRRSFDAAARRILDAARGDADGSVLDQMLSSARSIVRVRRTGEVEGDSAEAVVARIERRLEQDDLAGARKQAESLSAEAMDAAGPWLDKLDARLSVDRAIAEIDERLKRSLTAPPTN